jgi:hypothetical protein
LTASDNKWRKGPKEEKKAEERRRRRRRRREKRKNQKEMKSERVKPLKNGVSRSLCRVTFIACALLDLPTISSTLA